MVSPKNFMFTVNMLPIALLETMDPTFSRAIYWHSTLKSANDMGPIMKFSSSQQQFLTELMAANRIKCVLTIENSNINNNFLIFQTEF
jgi:hypothetical protein